MMDADPAKMEAAPFDPQEITESVKYAWREDDRPPASIQGSKGL